jgi:hypothetical protein
MSSRIEYPRDEVWEAVFYKTIELALDRPHLMLLPERRNVLEPLEYLEGAEYPGDCVAVREGATYKSLAYIAHRFGFNDEDRQLWYRIAKRLHLSQAHIGCIVARLNDRDELFAELDQLVTG